LLRTTSFNYLCRYRIAIDEYYVAILHFDCTCATFRATGLSEKEIQDLTTTEGFEILWIQEEYEEPVTLFLISSRRL